MKRRQEFSKAVFKPITVNDSRFGIRKLFMTTKERPSIGQYQNPGRAWHGTK